MENSLIPITTDQQGALLVDSLDFAAGLDIQHKNLLETIRTHRGAIEADFGLIAFETRKVEGKGRPETFAMLTEDQALFVGTLSRNSARVIAFKSVLVRSFAEARRRTDTATVAGTAPSTEQMMLTLMQQQGQLISGQQELLQQLRADIEQIKQSGQRPSAARSSLPRTPTLPGLMLPPPNYKTLRHQINRAVNLYAEQWQVSVSQTYAYLYERLYSRFGISAYKLKQGRENILDALERHGHLDRLYSLIRAELAYTEE